MLAVFAFSMVALPMQGGAASRTCKRLERQLVLVSRGSSRHLSPKATVYKQAIAKQQKIITKTKRQIQRGGCNGSIFKRRKENGAACMRLKRSLDKMRYNVRKLQRKFNRYSGGGKTSASRERRRIKKALAANRCNEIRTLVASNRSGVLIERKSRRRSIIEQVFGEERAYRKRLQRNGENYDRPEPGYPQSRAPRRGTYRTLCVRTCDGYYFPISFSTTPQNFDRDVDACAAKCPGTETELYYHAARGEAAEDMISYATKEPYAALPNAFSYRKEVTPGCGCRFSQPGFSVSAGDGANPGANGIVKNEEPVIPLPRHRIDRGEDPETLANQIGSFIPQEVKAGSHAVAVAKPMGKRKVRVVGQAFFPTQ